MSKLIESLIGDVVLHDITGYQRLVGKLLYATITRPDISYVVHSMQQPKKSHLEAPNTVIRYLKGTVGQGIWLNAQTAQTELHVPTQGGQSQAMW